MRAKCLLLFALLGLLLPNFTFAQEEDPSTRLDNVFTRATEEKDFNGAVLVIQGDTVLLDKGYGEAEFAFHSPVTPETKFRIGSITKQFTAIGILLLEEEGLLSVEDHVCDYIPDCPAAWADITLFHLITHTSGIPNYTSLARFLDMMGKQTTPAGLIATFRDLPLDFEPGTDNSYSNSGYAVLGQVINEVSGQSYGRFLTDRIFEPLGMTNTAYEDETQVVENRATGYATFNRVAAFVDMSVPFAAGGLYSTTHDLYTWMQALFQGDLLSPEHQAALFADAVAAPMPGMEYSYGLSIQERQGVRLIGHDGGINGFMSSILYAPEQDLTIVVLANVESVSAPSMALLAADIVLDDE